MKQNFIPPAAVCLPTLALLGDQTNRNMNPSDLLKEAEGWKAEQDKYLNRARAAQEVGAHVAALMEYRSAADVACNHLNKAWYTAAEESLTDIVQETAAYAARLKKPEDRQAVHDWASCIATCTLKDEELGARINSLLDEKRGETDATA